ncbi:MBL fold metallo-hydrolase [Streptomyces cinnamoneus]|uniref:MBL fold metallo-hydrolase n=1 Tax=Streptomyces cinnamoneus TaxID=53446 RepID=A0A918TPE9_STRCJ|nr:MBL fold metallo-hydrolase [Streptomyces cinnamoneus]GHC55913.1 MBL fold metallo-hydrolase [Streptomyces cinnamoneus]
METTRVTPDIWMFTFAVGQSYAVRLQDGRGWALVDTGLPGNEGPVLDALAGLGARPQDVRDIVLTHYHFDHTGSAAALAAATGARVLAGAADAPVIRGELPEPPPVLQEWEIPLFESVQAGLADVPPAQPCGVDRELVDGDVLDWGEEVRVVAVPGHTDGSVALHLTSSGVLFTGDTIANVQQLMPGVFNTDLQQTIASFHRQAALDVRTACFGHGAPIVGGAGEALRAAAEALTAAHQDGTTDSCP